MLGAARNPKLWKADEILKQFANERNVSQTFRANGGGCRFRRSELKRARSIFRRRRSGREDAVSAAGAWSDADTTRKIPCRKIICISREKNGAEIISEAEVIDMKPLADNVGYDVEFKLSTRFLKDTGSGSRPEA